MRKVLVSRCLLGHPVRYDGGAQGPFALLERWQALGLVVPLCPEVAGGLPTPLPPAEIRGARGADALAGLIPVLTIEGEDVSAAFLGGHSGQSSWLGRRTSGLPCSRRAVPPVATKRVTTAVSAAGEWLEKG